MLREHAALFLSLLVMMLSIGLEELQSKDNIRFLRDALQLDLSDADARIHLLGTICFCAYSVPHLF